MRHAVGLRPPCVRCSFWLGAAEGVALALAGLVVGCAGGAGAAPEPRSEPRNEAAPRPSLQQDAGAAVGEEGRDAALAAEARSVPKMELGLNTVLFNGDSESEVRLAPLGDTMFVHDGRNVGRLEGRDLVQDSHLSLKMTEPECLLPTKRILTLAGRWPDAAYLSAVHQGETTAASAALYRWQRNRWARVGRTKDPYTEYVALLPWGNGGVVGAARRTDLSRWYDVETFDPKPASPFSETLPPPDTPMCQTRLDAFALAVAGASIFVAGRDCLPDGSSSPPLVPAVEIFERGRKAGSYAALPRPSGTSVSVTVVLALAPNDAYVGGGYTAVDVAKREAAAATTKEPERPYLVHFDGKTWQEQQLPIAGGVTSLAAEARALWVTAGGRLWKRDDEGNWFEVRLPKDVVASRVVVRAPGDIWLEAAGNGDQVLRTIAPGQVLEWRAGCP